MTIIAKPSDTNAGRDLCLNPNAKARTETAEMARDLDKKVEVCWMEHANRAIVTNKGTFADKMESASKSVLALL